MFRIDDVQDVCSTTYQHFPLLLFQLNNPSKHITTSSDKKLDKKVLKDINAIP